MATGGALYGSLRNMSIRFICSICFRGLDWAEELVKEEQETTGFSRPNSFSSRDVGGGHQHHHSGKEPAAISEPFFRMKKSHSLPTDLAKLDPNACPSSELIGELARQIFVRSPGNDKGKEGDQLKKLINYASLDEEKADENVEDEGDEWLGGWRGGAAGQKEELHNGDTDESSSYDKGRQGRFRY